MPTDRDECTQGTHALQTLIRYKGWAFDLTLKSLDAVPGDELTKIRPTTFKTILHTLNHITVVDDIFRSHLKGEKHEYTERNTKEAPCLSVQQKRATALCNWYTEFTDAQSSMDLNQVIDFEFVDGGQGAMSRAEILHHIVNHTTYHIGYVSDMMYQIPLVPPASDLTVFLRDIEQH